MDGNAPLFYANYLATHEGLLGGLAFVALVAVIMCDRQRWRVAVLLSCFPAVYSAVVALQAVRNDRTIMLILPPLAVLGVLAVEAPVTTYAHSHRAIGLAAAGTAVAVLVVEAVARLPYPPPSTWNATQHWLDTHTLSGTSVLIEPYDPWLNPARYKAISCGRVVECPPPRGGYVVASEGMYGRFTDDPKAYPGNAAAYQRLFQQLPQVAILMTRSVQSSVSSKCPQPRRVTNQDSSPAQQFVANTGADRQCATRPAGQRFVDLHACGDS